MLGAVASSLFFLAMGTWLGGVVFFSFFTAPVIFERLPRNQAADVVAVIFPRYYNLGYGCGFVMMLAGLHFLWSEPGRLLPWVAWVIAAMATGVSLYAGLGVMPRVRRLRLTAASSAGTPEHPANRVAYSRAHQLSVTLNSVVLLLLVAETLLFGYAVRTAFSA